nr:MAG TPA: hypothetical protein [Caudoviricetes sp.]
MLSSIFYKKFNFFFQNKTPCRICRAKKGHHQQYLLTI